jgi:acetyl esterase/lipase
MRLIAMLTLLASVAATVAAAHAQQSNTYALWTGRAPGARSGSPADTPRLTWLAPSVDANGTAVIIAPGGGYVDMAAVLEGTEPASWFTMRGITAFVLQYRVGATAPLPLPLLDGARAVRFVRAHAARFHIDPNRIGMLGFSAGGHLTAMTALQATAGDAKASDPVERVSGRPDFLILAYPWLEATDLMANGHSPYCDAVIEETHAACRPQDYSRFTPTAYVTRNAPPTFLYLTTDDDQVAPDGSLRLYQALWEHHVPVEIHIFAHGRHASVFGGADPSLSSWPHLLQEWLRSRGLRPRLR